MKQSAPAVGGLAIATMLAGPSTAAGQNAIEVRGADTEYRYADWSHTWPNAAVVDLFYVGVPGSNELNLGGGYSLARSGLVVTPLVYAVIGKEESQRGIRRSNTIQVPSGETSRDVQVPSVVVKSISRVWPRGLVTSQLVSGFCSWAKAGATARPSSNATTRPRGERRIGVVS